MANTCNGDTEEYSGNDDKLIATAKSQQRFLSRGLHNYTNTHVHTHARTHTHKQEELRLEIKVFGTSAYIWL